MLLLAALLVAASPPAHGVRTLPRPLLLRGGATPTVSSRPSHAQRIIVPYSPAGPVTEMSDAERIYVVHAFTRTEVQKEFLKKVFAIVAAQLMATGGVMAVIRGSPALLIALARIAPIVLFAPLIPAIWLQYTPESGILPIILLAVYTLFQAAAMGLVTAALPAQLVLNAAGATSVAVGSLSIYALTTKRDFTMHGGMLAAGLSGLLVLSILQIFLGGLPLNFTTA